MWTKRGPDTPAREGSGAHHRGPRLARQTPPAAPDKRAPPGNRLARGSPGGVWARDIPCIDGLSLVRGVLAQRLTCSNRAHDDGRPYVGPYHHQPPW
jgi:hypothetical protein